MRVLGVSWASSIEVAINRACGLNRFPACTYAPVMLKSSTGFDVTPSDEVRVRVWRNWGYCARKADVRRELALTTGDWTFGEK